MVDNVTLDSMSGGDTVGADDIGGVKYQRVKIIEGADGTNDGDISATNGLPVQLLAGSAAVGKLAANSGVDIGDVDVLTLPADPLGANADAAATAGSTGSISAKLRLATSQLDSIKTAVETLDNTVGGSELQVDIVGSLPAGSAAIGKLAANSGVDIGDVDVITLPADPLGANADAAATAGSTGSLSAKMRLMTSQLDSIKSAVEGTETAVATETTLTTVAGNTSDTAGATQAAETLLTAIDADTSAMVTALQIIDNIVSGSEAQVDIVGALPAGTNGIGKLTANSGVDIGDVDILSIANGSLNGPGAPTVDSYTKTAIAAVTGSNQVLIAAPGASKQIWVYGIGFTCTVAGTVAIQDEDDTAITGVVNYAQYSGPWLPPSGNFAMPLFKVATNKALEADVVTATINGFIAYAIVSV